MRTQAVCNVLGELDVIAESIEFDVRNLLKTITLISWAKCLSRNTFSIEL